MKRDSSVLSGSNGQTVLQGGSGKDSLNTPINDKQLGKAIDTLKAENPDLKQSYNQWKSDATARIEAKPQSQPPKPPRKPKPPVKAEKQSVTSSSRFDRFVKSTLGHEGGYVNDKFDRGGETNYGITKDTLQGYQKKFGGLGKDGKNIKIKDLTVEHSKIILKKGFYDQYRIDEIANDPLADKALDLYTNHKPDTAAKLIQNSINEVVPGAKLEVDGVMGSKTIKALNQTTPKQQKTILKTIIDRRIKHYEEQVKIDPLQSRYLKGWTKRAKSYKN